MSQAFPRRFFSRWRPLAAFWAAILAVAAAAAAVLQILGPPPGQAAARTAAALPVPAGFSVRSQPPRIAFAPAPDPPALGWPALGLRVAFAAKAPPPAPPPPDPDPAPQADGGGKAAQLAAQLGLAPAQIAPGAAGGPGTAAIIRLYAASSHAQARTIGQALAKLGYRWRIENRAGRPQPPGGPALEVLTPEP